MAVRSLWGSGSPANDLYAVTTTFSGPGEPMQSILHSSGDGVWNVVGSRSWSGASYLYLVRVFAPTTGKVETNLVTDPYSVALTADSTRSVVASLSDPSLTPSGWAHLRKPATVPSTASQVYELQVRDFSIGDSSVPAAHRGTYAAFTDSSSAGMRHLRALASAVAPTSRIKENGSCFSPCGLWVG